MFFANKSFYICDVPTWMYIILIALIAYVVISLLIYFIQDLFFFHPEKLRRDFKFQYEHPFEEVELVGVENSLIDGLYFPANGEKKVVFYFKGNTRSIKGWAKFAKDFNNKGYSFFLIDYPGFGKSTGKRNVETIHRNAQIAYNWLLSRFEQDDIIIYGRSLGAGFATYIAKSNAPHVLILDSPFYSFRRLSRYYTRILPLKFILKYRSPLFSYLEDVKCPVFILHGDKDHVIPYSHSVLLEDVDPKHIKLYTIAGARHNNLPKFKEYHTVLNRILNEEALYKKYSGE